VLCQLVAGPKPSPAVTRVRPSIAVDDQMFGQLLGRIKPEPTSRTFQRLHRRHRRNDAVRLDRLQPTGRLYVTIEVVGELRLGAERLVADPALERAVFVHGSLRLVDLCWRIVRRVTDSIAVVDNGVDG